MRKLLVASLLVFLGVRHLLRPKGTSSTRRRQSSCRKGGFGFEDPTPGATFTLGTTYDSQARSQVYNDGRGLTANLADITLASGSTFPGLGEIVNAPPHPFGSGQMLRLNNAVLVFDLKRDTQRGEFEYLDKGGTVNIGVRGRANMYVDIMDLMPKSMVINGVRITRSNVMEFRNKQGVKVGERGLITLEYSPDIGSLIIGGSEMHLDNFCFN